MVKTIFLLLITIIILPIVAINFDAPLTTIQWAMVSQTFWVMIVIALLCFVVSELTGNCSQTDKLWSITPILYTWHIAALSDWNARVVLMAILATIWGVRLTYNFGRRGAYQWKFWEGHEDYRWEIMRKKSFLQNKWVFTLFNLMFISLYQHALIWLFTLPIVVAFEPSQGISIFDIVLAIVFVGFVTIETIADQQQWNFQNEKHRRIKAGEPLGEVYSKGFTHTGLWAKVRHPNYASEQSIWVVFYLFTIVATGRWLNWSMAGSLLLILLFQGSADFSEGISEEKYPDYKDYIKKTPRFLPKIFN